MDRIQKAYEEAKARYAEYGVDVEEVLKRFAAIPISIPSWQLDDVGGFELNAGGTSGGIMATGDYPGKPANIEEFRRDLEEAMSYIPGPVRINLHASYGENYRPEVDRDAYGVENFAGWIRWAKERHTMLDFNATTFGHPMAADGLTISNPNDEKRAFWVRHMAAARDIAAEFGKAFGKPCVYNTWIQDGIKDMPANRYKYRALMKDSFDRILSKKIPSEYVYDALEPKLFGIGVESYTVGSNDFYLCYHGYARSHGIGNTILNLDMGHFHPLENVSDKISSVALFSDKFTAHLTRGIRWDSDHVLIYDDATCDMMREIVRSNLLDKAFIGTDYFDATINRVAALVIGTRAAKRTLLNAMLEPVDRIQAAEDAGDLTSRLAWMDEFRTLPVEAVWQKFCLDQNVEADSTWLNRLKIYEKDVMFKRREAK